MNKVVAIVEGETELTFVRDQLAAHLGFHNTTILAVLPGRHRNHGGVKEWNVAKQDIIRTLREGGYCTTMFDYYGMSASWPGRKAAKALPWDQRATHVETQIHADITAAMGNNFNSHQFIPYAQLHEFEALLFTDVRQLVSVVAANDRNVQGLEEYFGQILAEAGGPEAINDNYETCPARRITKRVKAYKKRVHGPIVTKRIGLPALRSRCLHFASWLERLESIGNQTVPLSPTGHG